ncbi:MAG: NAD(P)-binding domain-containing protein [Alphaproteobacteria bacterium]|nr:NAD(P)-binding domain-containing protein [Alphaproteobacteria bacterium]MBU2271971.1 NAD(P)-binding domain-containing protein [Alphaproteobacteria bacterium]
MTDSSSTGSVVLLGCGRLGSAILEGWLATGTVAPSDLIILSRSAAPTAEAARALGARINPPSEALSGARALVLAVKPASWREALGPLVAGLPQETPIVSVMAGVGSADIAAVAQRPVVRVMPTTAVAQARGVAALWAADPAARETARGLFDPIADVVDLDEESVMDVATGVAGSAPAFIYAFVQALARAGAAQGLAPDAAARLARGALRSAGAGAETGAALEDLVARIASPGGTTRAGLDAMESGDDLDGAARAAVDAAVQRARAISG